MKQAHFITSGFWIQIHEDTNFALSVIPSERSSRGNLD